MHNKKCHLLYIVISFLGKNFAWHGSMAIYNEGKKSRSWGLHFDLIFLFIQAILQEKCKHSQLKHLESSLRLLYSCAITMVCAIEAVLFIICFVHFLLQTYWSVLPKNWLEHRSTAEKLMVCYPYWDKPTSIYQIYWEIILEIFIRELNLYK